MNHFMPVRLITGADCVRQNAHRLDAFGSRCLIVTGAAGAKQSGALADAAEALNARHIAWQVFDGVRQNPSVAVCAEGGAAARAFGASFILGIGGGSPLDAAKAVAVFAANPDLSEAGLYAENWAAPALPCVLIGTTAGTGSEVTPISVLTGAAGRKKGVRSEKLYAALSFGDTRYTATLPRAFTLSTGVDALSHCIESYFSRKADAVSRAFAARGAMMLLPALSRAAAAAEGAVPPEVREDLYAGSILGGLAINATGTAVPHNVGYYLTERYNIPHGIACGVFQDAFLAHMERTVPETYAAFLREIGVGADALRAVLRACVPNPGIRMTEAEIAQQLPRWDGAAAVHNALGDYTLSEIRSMLLELFC